MKITILILMVTICLSNAGCSALSGLIAFDPVRQFRERPETALPLYGTIALDESQSFEVYQSAPYALHLEFLDALSQSDLATIYGDGGASLNAYAACLTLKVMF